MESSSKTGPSEERKSKKRLPFSKLVILYFIADRGSYDGSILQLSKDMGYPTDSNVNKNINELVRDGYLLDKPVFKLTKAGERQLAFSKLPEVTLVLMLCAGFAIIAVSLSALLGFGPIDAPGMLGIGVALVIVAYLFFKAKREIYDEFLGLRKALSTTESRPVEDREPSSAP